ncbi:MAG: hypothetical protein ACRD2D_09450, partial [Terriglobales bacterium]
MNNSRVFLCALGVSLFLGLSFACGGQPGAAAAPGSGGSAAAAPVAASGRLFTAAAAQWLYAAPQGSGLNISGMLGGARLALNAHDGGFDFPVQYTDGKSGCTSFTDRHIFNYADQVCVPNPEGGFHPSVGGWGANDGHLVVIDQSRHKYYEFWKLIVDGSGQPTSTDVGQVVEGDLSSSDGAPGTTASGLSGLAGDILPGELDCDTCLQHALSVVVPSALDSPQTGSQAPARKTDGSVPGAIFRDGAKIRLDPSFNVDGLQASVAVKAVLHALQRYGAVITDQTSGNTLGFYSALGRTPDLSGLQQAAA